MNTGSAPTTPTEPSGAASPTWVLAGLSLGILLSSLGTSIANVALPSLGQAFDAPFQQVQWIVLAYLLAITVTIVSVGRLGDLIGRRRLLLTGLALFALASLLCGIATQLWWLIAARALQGLAAATMLALALALVVQAVPAARSGSAMGLMGTMSAVGTALGPSLGGALVAVLGWRAIFFIKLPLALLAFVLVRRHLPIDCAQARSTRIDFDLPGTALLALTLAAYTLALTLGHGTFGSANLALLAAAVVGAGLFVWVEARSGAALIQLSMLRNPRLSSGFTMSILVSTVVMATLVVGPYYLWHALSLDAARVGLVMSAGPIVSALTGVPAGRLVDRVGAQRVSVIGLVVMIAGSMALAMLAPASGSIGYVLPLIVLTSGYGLFQAANNTAVMGEIGAAQRGLVSGMLNLSRNLGLISGASLMGAVFAHAMTASSITADAVVVGMRVTFTLASVLIAVALTVALVAERWYQRMALNTVARHGSIA
jgi:EmrB/QacA subfamily drug resistance transporter